MSFRSAVVDTASQPWFRELFLPLHTVMLSDLVTISKHMKHIHNHHAHITPHCSNINPDNVANPDKKSTPVMLMLLHWVCQRTTKPDRSLISKTPCLVQAPATSVTVSAGLHVTFRTGLRDEAAALYAAAGGGTVGCGGSCSICRIRKLFSSMNCSSSVRSSRKFGRKRSNFSRLPMRIFCTAYDLLGFATKT